MKWLQVFQLVGLILLGVLFSGCGLIEYQQGKNFERQGTEYNQQAEKFFKAGRYQEAVTAYTSMVHSINAARSACFDAGRVCKFDWKKYNNDMRIIYTRRGWARFRAGDRQGAITDVQYAVNKYPKVNYPQSWYLLGLLHLDAGNRAEALRAHAVLKKQNHDLAQKLAEQLQRFK